MERPTLIRRICTAIALSLKSRASLTKAVQRLRQEKDTLRHEITLKNSEIASLGVQLQCYRDTVESVMWGRRAEGAEAKAYTESLRQTPNDQL